MKKLWLLPMLALFLAACGNDEEAKDEDEISIDTIEPEEDTAESDTIAPVNSEMTLEEENDVLKKHIPVGELTSRVETDNPGKRIILFENQSGEKVYKSIFIKHDQYVKIIDLKDDNLLYEGQIKE
ncbi:hypothetical protein [Sporosarcina sp.]|uniref:hypothetical protein n=1 Tax=Sporosarcina sp. TaxID=49982 RepID=UPI002620E4BD|nr:hypothetical protein [Sporosarcina sp.]